MLSLFLVNLEIISIFDLLMLDSHIQKNLIIGDVARLISFIIIIIILLKIV